MTSTESSLEQFLSKPNEGLSFDAAVDPRPKAKITEIIVRGSRGRKDYGNIIGLAESLKKHGLLNAITVEKGMDDKLYLIAGERRLRAATLAGWTHIPYHFKNDVEPLEIKMLELIENEDRHPLEWHEKLELLAQIDAEMKKKHGIAPRGQSTNPEDPRWSTDKTAAFVQAHPKTVSNEISFAEKLRKRPDIKERVKHLNQSQAAKVLDQIEKREDVERMHKQGLIKTNASILEGDMLVLIKSVADNSIDLVLTDPPFGYDALSKSEGSVRGDTHQFQALMRPDDNLSMSEVRSLMQGFIPELYRVLKPGCHFYIFFSLDLYNPLQSLCDTCGLRLHDNPLIWEKGEENTTPFNGYNYMACYESILFGWKPLTDDPKEKGMKRLNKPMKSILKFKTMEEKKRRHIFHKPTDLLASLIENSTNKGDLVLDPFCGSGESIKVAHHLGRSGLGFEKNHDHWIMAQTNLLEV